MPRIKNYEELVLEKNRLQQSLILQKSKIRGEISSLKEKMEPLLYLVSLLGIFKKTGTKNSLLKMGAKAGIELLAHQTLVSKAGWLAKLVIPFVLKNVSSGVIDRIKEKRLFRA